jgi:hypothetical protein
MAEEALGAMGTSLFDRLVGAVKKRSNYQREAERPRRR